MQNTKKINRTRRDISTAFIALLLEKDFNDISIIEICDKAIITRATFYKYFEDKYHLVSCIIDDYKSQIVEDKLSNYSYSTPQELFMYIAHICLDLIEEHREQLSRIYAHCKKQKINEQILDIIEFNITQILQEKKSEIQYRVPVKLLSSFFSGGLTKLAFAMLENPKIYKKCDILEFLELEINNRKFIAKK